MNYGGIFALFILKNTRLSVLKIKFIFRCHFLPPSSHRLVRYCALFGDPHLLRFDGTFETCSEEGARPLVENRQHFARNRMKGKDNFQIFLNSSNKHQRSWCSSDDVGQQGWKIYTIDHNFKPFKDLLSYSHYSWRFTIIQVRNHSTLSSNFIIPESAEPSASLSASASSFPSLLPLLLKETHPVIVE